MSVMNDVNSLKQDIAKTKAIVKQEQVILKDKAKNGMFDGSETVLSDNRDYFQNALKKLEKEYVWDEENKTYKLKTDNKPETNTAVINPQNIKATKTFKEKIKENIKKIFK